MSEAVRQRPGGVKVVWSQFGGREDWLAHRAGIGASEAGAVCGVGFKSALQLWDEKRNGRKPDDLSGNERVDFGNRAEEPLRGMFRLMFPQYELEFEPFTVLRQEGDLDFMFFTPDGWLTEKETGKRGLYESKTATILSGADWGKWKNKVPESYYLQILHGMQVGDFDFAEIFAMLRKKDGDAELRHYRFDREDCAEDIKWLVEKETEFWGHVVNGTMPAVTIGIGL